VLAALKPELAEACFMGWVRAIKRDVPGEQIAIDGKALHIASVRAAANRLAFGQAKAGSKSNEITAIPALLGKTALGGCVASIDAMGYQHGIAGKLSGAAAFLLPILPLNWPLTPL
jgi:hypothetical protein